MTTDKFTMAEFQGSLQGKWVLAKERRCNVTRTVSKAQVWQHGFELTKTGLLPAKLRHSCELYDDIDDSD